MFGDDGMTQVYKLKDVFFSQSKNRDMSSTMSDLQDNTTIYIHAPNPLIKIDSFSWVSFKLRPKWFHVFFGSYILVDLLKCVKHWCWLVLVSRDKQNIYIFILIDGYQNRLFDIYKIIKTHKRSKPSIHYRKYIAIIRHIINNYIFKSVKNNCSKANIK